MRGVGGSTTVNGGTGIRLRGAGKLDMPGGGDTAEGASVFWTVLSKMI